MSADEPEEKPPSFRPPRRHDRRPSLFPAGGLELGAAPRLIDRFRALRRRDLAFILSGLAVLFMAPVAEHLLTGPEDDPGPLSEGFDRKGPLFAEGGSIYDPGTGGWSPGGLPGQDNDVVTPLNVRDPSALIMGPGAVERPAVGSANSAVAEKGKADGWHEALDAARRGAKQAAQTAQLPKPPPRMTGALRGLAALDAGRGGGPSVTLPALTAQHAPNRARESGSLTRSQAAPGFRGPASRSPASGSALEALKAAGARQADAFNRGPAGGALETASREAVPGGAPSPGGRVEGGAETKSPSGTSSKDNRNVTPAEDLAFLSAKENMLKGIDLKWKKKEWRELGRQKMGEEILMKTGAELTKNLIDKGLIEPMAKRMAEALGGKSDAKQYICQDAQGGILYSGPGTPIGNKLQVGDREKGFVYFDCHGITPMGSSTSEQPARQPSAARPSSPPPVSARPQMREASGLAERIGGLQARHCAEGRTDARSAAFCGALAGLKQASDEAAAASQKESEARARLVEAYGKMTGAVEGMERGRLSLEDAHRGLRQAQAKGKEAAAHLETGDPASAERSLAAAGQAADAAGRREGAGCSGALQAACANEPSVRSELSAAAGNVELARSAASAAQASLQSAEDRLRSASGAAVSAEERPSFQTLTEDVRGTLDRARSALEKTGGPGESLLKKAAERREATAAAAGRLYLEESSAFAGTVGRAAPAARELARWADPQDPAGLSQRADALGSELDGLEAKARSAGPSVLVGLRNSISAERSAAQDPDKP